LNRMLKSDDEILEEEAQDIALSAKKKASIGKDILRGFASKDAPQFGQESVQAPLRRKVASQKHVDTMHMLAAMGRKKSDNAQ
jgi:hypothetical protein